MDGRQQHQEEAGEVILVTPTWEGVLPMLLAVMRDGTAEGRRSAAGELRRMAQAADRFNAIAKAGGGS